MNKADYENRMRNQFKSRLEEEKNKNKPNEKVLGNLRAQYAEWDLNARN